MIEPIRHTPLLPGTLRNLFYPPDAYRYFARAAEVPFVGANPIAKAAWAADASMLSYGRYGQRLMSDVELEENFGRAKLRVIKIGGTPGDWNAHGTQAAFAYCDEVAIMAFRGTERDDPDDVLSDADLFLSHEPDYRQAAQDATPALGHLGMVAHLFSEPCLVHRGFQRALNQVWKEVHAEVGAYRRQHPEAEICMTGHSLGAALAVMSFSRFGDGGMSLYTFGCPRVGDAAFRDRVLSNPGRGIYRFVNYNDAVTHVPTESLLYRQTPAECQRFDEDGNLDTGDDTFRGDADALRTAVEGLPGTLKGDSVLDAAAPPSVVDHSPARYCFRLWDCV